MATIQIDVKTKHLRSETPGVIPAPELLEEGQLALNMADQKIFTKNSAGTVVPVGGDENALLLTGGTCTGAIYAPAFHVTSLREYKENINNFAENAVDLIEGLTVVNYNLKAEEEPKEQYIGLIADDTDPKFSGRDQNKIMLGNTVGILLKAVQELSERVKELEAQKNTCNYKLD